MHEERVGTPLVRVVCHRGMIGTMDVSRRVLVRRLGGLGLAAWVGCRRSDEERRATGHGGNGSDGERGSTGEGTSTHGPDETPDYDYDGPLGPEGLFSHGVASGDPLADRVILWTRVSPDAEGDLEVYFEVAADPELTQRITSGYATAAADRDHTLKLDVIGLEPATPYYYRFAALGRVSPIGRTRTAPSGPVERVRFGVCSCASLAHGYFHGYRDLAGRLDLDLVIHLGDYIYEYGNGTFGSLRAYEPPHEIITLADYRLRYAQYRREPELQELHRQHPMAAIWDDHEIANNAHRTGAQNHGASEGDWDERKAAATRAYAEWMPYREREEEGIIYRALPYGDLLDLILLDTRLVGRDPLPRDVDAFDPSPARTLLGVEQEQWLADTFAQSTARWRIVAQQVLVAPVHVDGLPTSVDKWDAYPAARDRFYDLVREHPLGNVIVLTGDSHSSWALELADDPYDPERYDPETGSGALAVEFVAPGITSPFDRVDQDEQLALYSANNPHLRGGDYIHRGFFVLDVTESHAEVAWYTLDRVDTTEPQIPALGRVWAVDSGTPRAFEREAPTPPPEDPPPGAP